MSVFTFEKFGNSFELRNVVLSIATVTDEKGQIFVVHSASVTFVQFGQFLEDHSPSSRLFFRVLNARNRIWTLRSEPEESEGEAKNQQVN
jgi:hypothetical protein